MVTIQAVLQQYRSQIFSETARLDAELILSHVLQCDRAYLLARSNELLSEVVLKQVETLLNRRVQGEPVAYIVGHKEFWGLDLAVNSSVLIPRPETELLVECVLTVLKDQQQPAILELGTGSGAIACALAFEKKDASIVAIDSSAQALVVAQHNAEKHQLQHIHFLNSNWFSALNLRHFDVIVSNPPYIKKEDPHLLQGDVRFEPAAALIAHDDGLAAIKHIIARAKNYLKPEGFLVFEHGFDQRVMIENFLKTQTCVRDVKFFLDLQQHPRVCRIQYHCA